MCADRDAASAEETVRRILDEGGQASEVVADIADPAGVEAMVAGAQHELGGLDGVVYNVGIGAAARASSGRPSTGTW